MEKTIIINLFGAPGSGKSTAMAYIFAKLKMRGVNCEMAPEFAKELYFEQNMTAFGNQVYILGNQYYRISRLLGKVDVIVTDSPIFVSVYYNELDCAKEEFNHFIAEASKGFNNKNYYLKRVSEYDPKGRHQTKEEAEEVGYTLLSLFEKYDIDFEYADSLPATLDGIVNDVVEMVNEK